MLRPVLGRCLAHGIRIVSNFGAANPARRGAPHRARSRASWACPRRASPWSTATTCPAPSAPRRCCARSWARRCDAPRRRQRQRLPRRRADRRGAARRRADRRDRPRGRPVARRSARRWRTSAGRADDWDRLGARDHGGPPARMRRAGHRRLLRRPRLQGRAGPRATSASRSREIDADGRCIDRQGRRHRRLRRRAHASRSSCSTRCTIPRPTSRPTWSADISRGRACAQVGHRPRRARAACAAIRARRR